MIATLIVLFLLRAFARGRAGRLLAGHFRRCRAVVGGRLRRPDGHAVVDAARSGGRVRIHDHPDVPADGGIRAALAASRTTCSARRPHGAAACREGWAWRRRSPVRVSARSAVRPPPRPQRCRRRHCPRCSSTATSRAWPAGVVAISGTLAMLIPPSIAMVVFGLLADVNIAKLLVAGIVPGVLVTLTIMPPPSSSRSRTRSVPP